jgi:hypothetical protein
MPGIRQGGRYFSAERSCMAVGLSYMMTRGRYLSFTDLGEQSLKNIARPVRAYAVAGDGPGQGRVGDAKRTPGAKSFHSDAAFAKAATRSRSILSTVSLRA